MPVPAEIEWYTISESLYRYADIAELRNEREEAEKVRAFAKGFSTRNSGIFFTRVKIYSIIPRSRGRIPLIFIRTAI